MSLEVRLGLTDDIFVFIYRICIHFSCLSVCLFVTHLALSTGANCLNPIPVAGGDVPGTASDVFWR